MTDEQIERSQKLCDAASALICAFVVGLICLVIATPASIVENTTALNVSQGRWAAMFFFAPFFVYGAFYFLVWRLQRVYKLGGWMNWLWILLLSDLTTWQFVVFMQNRRFYDSYFSADLNRQLPLLFLFIAGSFVPSSFIWTLGFCYRTVWSSQRESATTLNLRL